MKICNNNYKSKKKYLNNKQLKKEDSLTYKNKFNKNKNNNCR